MQKNNYVYSTLSADTNYVNYRGSANGMPVAESKVLIRGGTGVAQKHLVTPMGVVTPVNDEELAALQANEVFKIHMDNGFIRVDKRNVEPEKIVAADMNSEDESAPLSPKDYKTESENPEDLRVVVDKGKRKVA